MCHLAKLVFPLNSGSNMNYEDFSTLISTTSDLSTLYINVKGLFGKFRADTFTEVKKDSGAIEAILTECFIRKEILWQKPKYENLNWSINSLIKLQEKCDEYSSKNLTINNDKNHFFSQLMRLWGNHCNETYKVFYRNKDEGSYDLTKDLKKFRKKVYKILLMLIQLLPENNVTKNLAFQKIEIGCENSKLKIKDILPDWSIE